MMTAQIISTGDEILYGYTVDSNTAHIARSLVERGIDIVGHRSAGDERDGLIRLFREADGRSHVVIVTGGLGPTEDDRTVEAVAEAFGVKPVFDKGSERSVLAFFEKRQWPVPGSNRKQMMLPEGALSLENTVGTAPGFSFDTGQSLFFFLPGVPFEMRHMMAVHVIPSIERRMGRNLGDFQVNTLSHFGIAEAEVDQRLAGFHEAFPDVTLGLQAVFPVINVKLYARCAHGGKVEEALKQARDWVLERTGEFMFSSDNRSLAEEVGRLLMQQKKTLAVAESCTGGLIGHMMTNVAGSSDYFLFSGVTYSNRAKVNVLGVDEQVIEHDGAVSERTVCAMADGARRCSGADVGLSTSGIAGPGGGTEKKPVGTFFIGLSSSEGSRSVGLRYDFGDRLKNKTIFAMAALDLLRRDLLKHQKD